MPDRSEGPWQGRVRFAPDGLFAYRPNELLVPADAADPAERALRGLAKARDARKGRRPVDIIRQEARIAGAFVRFSGEFEPLETIARLRSDGYVAQVNHVLFATGGCPPHPASPRGCHGHAQCCACGCCGGGATANPIYANPIYANPIYANADPSPFAAPWLQSTGGRRSSARPAGQPDEIAGDKAKGVRIAILDTGWAQTYEPKVLPSIDVTPRGGDQPDEDGDGYLDPAAGHGMFVAGVIEQVTPGCKLEVIKVLSTYGDGDEGKVADILKELADRPGKQRPQIVNMSFGGYSPVGMGVLAHAIGELHARGTAVVASAGNDATCIPMYPAAFPEVVSVAALDAEGRAAPFTNYGEWVRACTRGTKVVSAFFEGFDGALPPIGGVDPDAFDGWAAWSGTSFAAPRVVAALAALVEKGVTPHQAVEQLVDDPALHRKPLLGTVVAP